MFTQQSLFLTLSLFLKKARTRRALHAQIHLTTPLLRTLKVLKNINLYAHVFANKQKPPTTRFTHSFAHRFQMHVISHHAIHAIRNLLLVATAAYNRVRAYMCNMCVCACVRVCGALDTNNGHYHDTTTQQYYSTRAAARNLVHRMQPADAVACFVVFARMLCCVFLSACVQVFRVGAFAVAFSPARALAHERTVCGWVRVCCPKRC